MTLGLPLRDTTSRNFASSQVDMSSAHLTYSSSVSPGDGREEEEGLYRSLVLLSFHLVDRRKLRLFVLYVPLPIHERIYICYLFTFITLSVFLDLREGEKGVKFTFLTSPSFEESTEDRFWIDSEWYFWLNDIGRSHQL